MYQGYCLRCCLYMLPDIEVSRNYKTKENAVAAIIKAAFPEYSWICDKRIQGGCSRRRPDMILDLGSHIVIVEIDENRHDDSGYECENRRMMELSLDVGHRPIVFIRFNPDAYITESGVRVASCWSVNKLGILCIPKKKEKEWKQRTDALVAQIQRWMDYEVTENMKTIETVHLFFN